METLSGQLYFGGSPELCCFFPFHRRINLAAPAVGDTALVFESACAVFLNMTVEDYEVHAAGMKDSTLIYGNLIRSIYSLGKVLGKKYCLLRITYTIFMIGLVLAIFSYILSAILYYRKAALRHALKICTNERLFPCFFVKRKQKKRYNS